jgi:hypothetical protein
MTQKKKKSTSKKNPGFKVSNKMSSYANDPMVIKRGRESKEFLDRVGFPDPSLYKK